MEIPTASIVIISYDPTAIYLARTFDVLRRQTYRGFELVLVDSGKKKLSTQILKNSGLNSQIPTTILPLPPTNTKAFKYADAYNLGIQKTQAGIVIRLSADAVPTNNVWLENLLLPFSNPKVGIVFGRYKKARTQEVGWFEWMNLIPYSIYEQLTWNFYQPKQSRHFTNSVMVGGACFAFRKRIWEEHQFNQDWFWGEEYEFAHFAQKKGFTSYYTPKVSVFHSHKLGLLQGIKRLLKDTNLAIKALLLDLADR